MVKEHNTKNYKRLVERLQAACNSITRGCVKMQINNLTTFNL